MAINLATNQDTHESVWRASRSAGLQVCIVALPRIVFHFKPFATQWLLAIERLDVLDNTYKPIIIPVLLLPSIHNPNAI